MDLVGAVLGCSSSGELGTNQWGGLIQGSHYRLVVEALNLDGIFIGHFFIWLLEVDEGDLAGGFNKFSPQYLVGLL